MTRHCGHEILPATKFFWIVAGTSVSGNASIQTWSAYSNMEQWRERDAATTTGKTGFGIPADGPSFRAGMPDRLMIGCR